MNVTSPQRILNHASLDIGAHVQDCHLSMLMLTELYPSMTLICFTLSDQVRLASFDRLLSIVYLHHSSIGHGAPGILSCLWLEDSLAPFIPQYSRDKQGLAHLISGFSTPGGPPR